MESRSSAILPSLKPKPPPDPSGRHQNSAIANARKAATGDDAELGSERLRQHRHEIGDDDDPQQLVAMGRAGGDVSREIAGVEMGYRGDKRRPGESQPAPGRPSGWPRAAEKRPGAIAGRGRPRSVHENHPPCTPHRSTAPPSA